MPSQNPLDHPCPHISTPQELDRDPLTLSCFAGPGQPCRWAGRFDGVTDPSFHAERLETAFRSSESGDLPSREAFDAEVLNTGLI